MHKKPGTQADARRHPSEESKSTEETALNKKINKKKTGSVSTSHKQSIIPDCFFSGPGNGGSRLLQLLHCQAGFHTHTHTEPTLTSNSRHLLCSPFKPATEATHSDQYSLGGAGSAKLWNEMAGDSSESWKREAAKGYRRAALIRGGVHKKSVDNKKKKYMKLEKDRELWEEWDVAPCGDKSDNFSRECQS